MTKDDILTAAREAGCYEKYEVCYFVREDLERFAALVAAHEREKQAEQIPVGYIYNDITHDRMPVYAAPVRTKDLTDAFINELHKDAQDPISFARAVIQADREKNK